MNEMTKDKKYKKDNLKKQICLTVAGSDSGCGAGIQADIKTFFSLNCYGVSILTAITAQNNQKVLAIESISHDLFNKQFEAIADDLMPKVIKSGMLANKTQIEILSQFLDKNPEIPYICDPVMIATSGDQLVSPSVIDTFKEKLFTRASLITPNLDEAIFLSDGFFTKEQIKTHQDLKSLAIYLVKTYHLNAILLKGGHFLTDDKQAIDYFYNGKNEFFLESKRIVLNNSKSDVHGSGCTLSAAITAFLTQDFDLENSVILAKAYITESIAKTNTHPHGNGASPIIQSHFPSNKNYFPRIFKNKISNLSFRPLNHIGLYPIVDSSDWVLFLAKNGIKTIQLRIKDKDLSLIEKEIKQAIIYQKKYDLQLFINDYYELALKYHAFGIHLGHEDLNFLLDKNPSVLEKISQNNLYLGLSTHDYYELSYALNINPSYVALGPIYETTTKKMRFLAQGIEKLNIWQSLSNVPLVAIGGINLSNIEIILATKVNGIAILSLITKAENPKIMIDTLKKLFDDKAIKSIKNLKEVPNYA